MTQFGGVSGEQLRSYIERIERLEEEKQNISEDIKNVYAEAKSGGFDIKIMRTIIRLRKMKDNDMEEQEYLLETYKRALGMSSAFDDAETEAEAA